MTTPHSARPGQAGQPGTEAGEQAAGVPPQAGPYGEHGDQHVSSYDVVGGPPAEPLGADLARAAWPAFLAAGIGSLVVGILLLAWPKATLVIVAVLIGVALVVAGLLRLVDGFTEREASGGRRVANVVIGLLAIIVGLFLVRHYHVTIAALAILVGLFWVVHGIADLAIGMFAGPFPGRGLTVFSGLLSLVAGLIVLFWPTISLTVLIAVIGIWLVIYGVLLGFMAFRLRGTGSPHGGAGRMSAA